MSSEDKMRQFMQQLCSSLEENDKHYGRARGLQWLYGPDERQLGGVKYEYAVNQDKSWCGLLICMKTAVENDALFEFIQGSKADIEKAFGAPFRWQEQNKKTRKFNFVVKNGWGAPKAEWDSTICNLIRSMRTFIPVVDPYLKKWKNGN